MISGLKRKFFFIFLLSIKLTLTSQINSKISADNSVLNLNTQDINNYENYSYLDSCVKNSRIIFLGESSHTTKEYSQIKYKLIKYLHEHNNFNIILFESGISDCYYANTIKSKKDSTWILTHSIYPIWWSKTTSSLMNYIKKANLTYAGFDYQSINNSRPEFSFIEELTDMDVIKKLFMLDSLFKSFEAKKIDNYTSINNGGKALDKLQEYLKTSYKELLLEIDSKKNIINDFQSKYLKRIVLNNLFLIKNYGNSNLLFQKRDSVMASNLTWFCDSLFRTDKIIVWAANDHIAKHRSTIFSHLYASSILPERIKQQSYSIGLYAYSGEMYAYPSNFQIKKPTNKSLEGRINKIDRKNDVFIDFKRNSAQFNWINKKITSYNWGKLNEKIIPIEYYDGVILINKVSLARNYNDSKNAIKK